MPEETTKKAKELEVGDVFEGPNSGTALVVTKVMGYNPHTNKVEVLARLHKNAGALNRQYAFDPGQKLEIILPPPAVPEKEK